MTETIAGWEAEWKVAAIEAVGEPPLGEPVENRARRAGRGATIREDTGDEIPKLVAPDLRPAHALPTPQ